METTTAIREGVPGEQIRSYAQNHDIDLVVMVTHSRSALKAFLGRSVTESVLRNSTGPVVAITE